VGSRQDAKTQRIAKVCRYAVKVRDVP